MQNRLDYVHSAAVCLDDDSISLADEQIGAG